jgi:hypothetical protein
LSQNYDKNQDQDRDHQRSRTQKYDFAHYIGLQQVGATQKNLRKTGGEVSTSHRFVPESRTALSMPRTVGELRRGHWSYGLT